MLVFMGIGLILVRTTLVGQGKVTIHIQMFEGPEFEAMKPTARFWNESYSEKTGTTIKVVSLDRVGYFGKLETQLISEMAEPDIVHPFSLHLGRLQAHLESLDPYLADERIMTSPNGRILSPESVLKVAMKTGITAGGTVLMLPKDMSEVILYYRKDLIPRPPETWEEYVELAKKYTRSLNPDSPTRYGTVMQGKYEMWTFCAALENIWPNGGALFVRGTTNPGFDNPGTVKGFSVFEELARTGVLPPEAINAEHPEVASIIQSGEVAMAIQWSAFYYELVDKEKSPMVFDKFDIAPPPGVRQIDGSVKRDMFVQTIGLALNRNSKYKREAVRFMVWAAMGEGAEIYAKNGGSSPVNAVWKNKSTPLPYSKIGPWVGKYGRIMPVHKDLTDLMMIGSSWVQRVMALDATAEEAAKGLNVEISHYLQTNREPTR